MPAIPATGLALGEISVTDGCRPGGGISGGPTAVGNFSAGSNPLVLILLLKCRPQRYKNCGGGLLPSLRISVMTSSQRFGLSGSAGAELLMKSESGRLYRLFQPKNPS